MRGRSSAGFGKAETIDRGWYSGGIGWTDGRGDGQIAVALRCALVRGDTAHLLAGAGIVADSVPEHEYQETLNKAGAMLQAIERAKNI